MIQKEESLDKKLDALEKKDETLNKKLKTVDERLEELETLKKSQYEMLERISGFSQEQAKEYLLKNLEDSLEHEKAVMLMEHKQKTLEEAETMAREIISTAIQRCAADRRRGYRFVVALPNDEMRGRIIGHGQEHQSP